MNDEDIKKQLEVKNKEIYLNKLNFDLDNNIEVLVLTVSNLLKIQSENLPKKIIEIAEGFENEKEIKKNITAFMNNYNNYLMNLFDQKKLTIKENLKINNDLEENKNKIKKIYDETLIELENESIPMVEKLGNSLEKYLDTDFKIKRLNSYLTDIFLKNLNNKVFDIMKNRDIILINTFNETYLKYLELNKNTVGVK